MKTRTIRKSALGAVAAVALSLIAACANPSDNAQNTQDATAAGASPSITMEKDDAIADKVPDQYKEAGTFAVAVNPSSPPLKYLDDNGEFTGLAPDLMNAAADVLGLKAEMSQTSFDALLPGLEAKRFDVILSINDFADRREQIDFIDYLWAGTAITGSTNLDQDSVTPDSLCGLSIGYARGNVQQGLLEKASKQCTKDGGDEVEAVGFQDVNAALLAVSSGQVDAVWGDATSMVYSAENEPDVYKVLYEEKSGPYGVGVHKDDADLRDALQAALKKCVEEGVYDELLDHYGLSDYALPKMPLNEGPENNE